jgi:hypothetical protein
VQHPDLPPFNEFQSFALLRKATACKTKVVKTETEDLFGACFTAHNFS